jgi:hypothetical protein
MHKISPLPGLDPRIVHPKANTLSRPLISLSTSARLLTEDVSKPTLWNESLHEDSSSDNGVGVVNLAHQKL